MVAHLLEDDLVLMVAGELGGPDLLRMDQHMASCPECQNRAQELSASSTMTFSSFSASVEQFVLRVESDRAPAIEMLRELDGMEIGLNAASHLFDESQYLNAQRGRILFYRAWLLIQNGSLRAARDAAIGAQEVFVALGDEVQYARARAVEGLALGELFETASAVNAIREAAAIFMQHQEYGRARIARGMEAAVLVVGSRYREAAVLFQKLISETATDDPARPHWLNGLAMSMMELGEVDYAEEIEAEVLAISGLPSEVRIGAQWVLAAAQARRGNLEEALARMKLVKAQAHALERRVHEMFATYTIAEVLSALGRTQEAVAMATEVVAYLTEQRISDQARAAIALLREAAERRSPTLFDELQNFRSAFPSFFPSAPSLRGHPQQTDSL